MATETTRIDILFERKHNKTHWNMAHEEQGVILKVNKQRGEEYGGAFSSFHRRQKGEVGIAREWVNVGVSNLRASVSFPPAVDWSRQSCLLSESA